MTLTLRFKSRFTEFQQVHMFFVFVKSCRKLVSLFRYRTGDSISRALFQKNYLQLWCVSKAPTFRTSIPFESKTLTLKSIPSSKLRLQKKPHDRSLLESVYMPTCICQTEKNFCLFISRI